MHTYAANECGHEEVCTCTTQSVSSEITKRRVTTSVARNEGGWAITEILLWKAGRGLMGLADGVMRRVCMQWRRREMRDGDEA